MTQPDQFGPENAVRAPRRGWLRFSLRTMLLATAAFALWFGYRARERDVVDRKLLVRREIAMELAHRHLVGIDKLTGKIISDMEKELTQSPRAVTMTVLRASPGVSQMPAKDVAEHTPEERDAILRIDLGESEIWDIDWDGGVRYFGVLWHSPNCGSCHTSVTGNSMPGSEMAVIRVDIRCP